MENKDKIIKLDLTEELKDNPFIPKEKPVSSSKWYGKGLLESIGKPNTFTYKPLESKEEFEKAVEKLTDLYKENYRRYHINGIDYTIMDMPIYEKFQDHQAGIDPITSSSSANVIATSTPSNELSRLGEKIKEIQRNKDFEITIDPEISIQEDMHRRKTQILSAAMQNGDISFESGLDLLKGVVKKQVETEIHSTKQRVINQNHLPNSNPNYLEDKEYLKRMGINI